MTKALLLIDIQNDYFPGGAFPLPGMEKAAATAAAVLAWARNAGFLIVHVRHEESDSEGGFLLQGTKGAEINPAVAPMLGEAVVTKKYPNSFRETELLNLLCGVSEVIVVGAMSNMCIDATARAAFDAGLAVTVVEDACAASDLQFGGRSISAADVHAAFMAALASAYGQVLNAAALFERAGG